MIDLGFLADRLSSEYNISFCAGIKEPVQPPELNNPMGAGPVS
jgi:hypothetical protein